MQRLSPVTLQEADGKAKELLTAVNNQMGATPNIFTAFANAPAALEGYLGLNASLAGGALSAQLR